MIGSKEQQARPLMRHLADRGWVCVAINYGLSPKVTWPQHLVDCKLALKWVREHIDEYGGDPGYVVVTGGSAGGHLAAMVGLTANRPEFQPGFENVDTTVRAMVPFYGVFDFLDRYGFRGTSGASFRRIAERHILKARPDEQPAVFAQASPLDQVQPEAPPDVCRARRPRPARPRARSPPVRRTASRDEPRTHRVRRACRCATRLRDVPLDSCSPHRRRRGRVLGVGSQPRRKGVGHRDRGHSTSEPDQRPDNHDVEHLSGNGVSARAQCLVSTSLFVPWERSACALMASARSAIDSTTRSVWTCWSATRRGEPEAQEAPPSTA